MNRDERERERDSLAREMQKRERETHRRQTNIDRREENSCCARGEEGTHVNEVVVPVHRRC